MRRVHGYGRVDRSVDLKFLFDGVGYLGHPGDTLASALLANDVRTVATSVKLGRPRGVMSAGVDEASAIVQVDAPSGEPMVPATTVELFDGLVAHGLPGRGRLPAEPDTARYDSMHAHCEVLVVGAGPAGLAAARTAARAGVRVVLVDDQPEPGGSTPADADADADDILSGWVAATVGELAAASDVRVLTRTTAFGHYDDGLVLALERRPEPVPPGRARHRVWRIRTRQTIVATGAHERLYAFAGNDLPGVLLAGAARTYLLRYGLLVGDHLVVATTNDSAYRVALALRTAGASVTVCDVRPEPPVDWAGRCAAAGIAVRAGTTVLAALGEDTVTDARLGTPDGAVTDTVPCDAVLVSGGWSPVAHLWSQAGGRLTWDAGLATLVPGDPVDAVRPTGAAAGRFDLAEALADGIHAAVAALAELGHPADHPVEHAADRLPTLTGQPAPTPPAVLWSVPDGSAAEAGAPDVRFVDLQRDATVADVQRATGAGLRSVEHVKRYTTIGTAHDQGKTSGLLAAGITAQALGVDLGSLGTTTFRPPYTPVSFAALAGRDRGALFDPERVTSIHPWHVSAGAVFENVGQWKRPQYYPRPGEDADAAVQRETVAARTGVAMMDASTLGKVAVQGRDAGEFLDRMYTNLMSTLKTGAVRYGVLCGLDGMVFDDGTVMRVDEREFVLTTTTGNAAAVLDWMEEFAQTEWPDLDVALTSVTEHWSTVAVVGPRSRDVIAAVAPGLDVSNEAFAFMQWRSATIGGVSARVARISFSGELAFEVNVPSWYGLALWERLLAAGGPLGITPYGTDAMHVLRAEKGYPIIGQDTDGTVTPQDLGMAWVVSKKKPDFVGKRSFGRPENLRPDRKHLVGLVPDDPRLLVPEGAQVLSEADVSHVPVPMLGHVTSSYRSAALGTTFALALVRSGRERIGERLWAWSEDELIPVRVTSSVLYDPEGARRDG